MQGEEGKDGDAAYLSCDLVVGDIAELLIWRGLGPHIMDGLG